MSLAAARSEGRGGLRTLVWYIRVANSGAFHDRRNGRSEQRQHVSEGFNRLAGAGSAA